eukprot:TRINITY_DN1743_c0_g2_i1.p1 TRINITY_DN1743_c0_g2~~TRINITY_DN1743_c0_g2_i1.p1  ORF type:complete len:157 (+),score=38.28 TRINITY_DN1743_c0_g2_i1:64-534(+)
MVQTGGKIKILKKQWYQRRVRERTCWLANNVQVRMLKRTLYNILVFPIKPLLRAVEKKKQEDKEQLSQCLKRSLELHALMEKQMVEIFRQKLQEEDEVSKELEKQKKEMDEKKAKMFELSNKALLSEIEADNVTDARGISQNFSNFSDLPIHLPTS